jgi:hypothetical protein
MKYLIKIGNEQFGYDSLEILKIDLITNKPERYTVFERQDGHIRLVYKEIDVK